MPAHECSVVTVPENNFKGSTVFTRLIAACTTALLFVGCFAGCASITGGSSAGASSSSPLAAVVMEEFRVASDPGIEVYVRNKRCLPA
jgi:hypothetical protein